MLDHTGQYNFTDLFFTLGTFFEENSVPYTFNNEVIAMLRNFIWTMVFMWTMVFGALLTEKATANDCSKDLKGAIMHSSSSLVTKAKSDQLLFRVYSGEGDEIRWQDDPDRIEPARERRLLHDFIAWAHPRLGRFPKLETGPEDRSETLVSLAQDIPYIIKHNAIGLNTKDFLGTVGGEDGRWVYPNKDFYDPVNNPTGIAVNFTEKFVQVLDFIDYLKTEYVDKKRYKMEGVKGNLPKVIKGLQIYLLGIYAHESRHGIDYKQVKTRDLSMLERDPRWEQWDGLIPDEELAEVRKVVDVFELSGFHLNFLYYEGFEELLEYAGHFIVEMRSHTRHKGKFLSRSVNGTDRNFSLLAEREINDFPTYYMIEDAAISRTIASHGGQFDFDMVGSTIYAYMYGQYRPSLALKALYDLNEKLESRILDPVSAIESFKNIEAAWLKFMFPDGDSLAEKVHTPLARVERRWNKESARFKRLTSVD